MICTHAFDYFLDLYSLFDLYLAFYEKEKVQIMHFFILFVAKAKQRSEYHGKWNVQIILICSAGFIGFLDLTLGK